MAILQSALSWWIVLSVRPSLVWNNNFSDTPAYYFNFNILNIKQMDGIQLVGRCYWIIWDICVQINTSLQSITQTYKMDWKRETLTNAQTERDADSNRMRRQASGQGWSSDFEAISRATMVMAIVNYTNRPNKLVGSLCTYVHNRIMIMKI